MNEIRIVSIELACAGHWHRGFTKHSEVLARLAKTASPSDAASLMSAKSIIDGLAAKIENGEYRRAYETTPLPAPPQGEATEGDAR